MKNFSVIIYGSSLRSDFDKYSDKDLLIVAEDFETLNRVRKSGLYEEWSVSYYTYSKLNYLSRQGSLFIQHLKRESEILKDYKNNFQNILVNYQPKEDYSDDIEDALKFFKVLKYLPNTSYGYAWFCDVLYVGLRNYLIFTNAKNEIFEFSWIKLIEVLKEQKRITQSDIEKLQELRVVKRNYREKILSELPSIEFVQSILNSTAKLNILPLTHVISRGEFQKNVVKEIFGKGYSPYQKLRLLEGYYCSQDRFIPELDKVISNPQFYSQKMKDNNLIMNLISQINQNYSTNSLDVLREIQKI